MALPTYDFSGIVSTADQGTGTYLPLESLDVYISIIDVSARVLLSQKYSHYGPDTFSEAYYVFPVPARAAVCSFEMKPSNGSRLKGVVKELSQAKEDYEEARSKGLLTGLLEKFRQDVLVVSIGSMPPNTEVTVLLSYVVDLSEDDEIDSVRFQLSSHARARYGVPSNSALYHERTHSSPLTITVDINMPGDILQATSLNHKPFVDLPVPATFGSLDTRTSRHFARKGFSATNFDLGLDFLLIVRAYGLGRPRCFAEHLSSEDNSSRAVVGPTTAFAFTVVPQFSSNIRPAQEYIFVIDRSGSMGGTRISMAKQTLQLLLKRLSTSSVFNIYSFGSTFYSMWPTSRQYTDTTVHEAEMHVNVMDAAMGGTELLNALMNVFGSRRQDIPTCVFVLTDGGIADIHSTVQAVSGAVSMASATAPLRVFTLGMGSGASTELCQRLASVGNGSCIMTVEGEPLAFKATRMVKAMETPQVKGMRIDWGHGVVGQVRQAPHRIGALSPEMRLLVTAIISGEQFPTEVTLVLDLVDGTTFNYLVPVEPVSNYISHSLTQVLGATDIPPLIHTLAAHLLIQDLEGGNTQPLELQRLTAPSPETGRNIIKRNIVELGTQYQVASSRTAFVAVSAPTPSSKPPPHHGNKNTRNSRSIDSRHSSSSESTSSNHDQESKNGHGNGTYGHPSDTNGKRNTKSSASQDSRTRGDANMQTSVKPDDEGSTTPSPPSKANVTSSKTSQSSPASQRASIRSRTSASHASQSRGRSASNSEKTQSQSPTSKMPGAFKQSPDIGTTGTGGLFDFFTYRPSLDSVLVEEVVCVPDPQGGSPMIFTAPPPYYTTITTIARSWLKSLKSFIFAPSGTKGNKQKPATAFPVMHKASFPNDILRIADLQSSDGSFPLISRELSLIVSIPEIQLRTSVPSMAYGENNESIWATAIAIAFCTKRLFEHVALWEETADKGREFGSKMCRNNTTFEDIIQHALTLF